MSTYLHPEHGLNPSMGACYFCGADTGELLLLGANKGEQAALRTMVPGKACKRCKSTIDNGGILLVCVVEDAPPRDRECTRAGKMLAITKESFLQLGVHEPLRSEIVRAGAVFLPQKVWTHWGLDEVMANLEKEQPEDRRGKKFVRTQFDYKRAWKEVVLPMFEALPPEIHELRKAVVELAGHCKQDKQCNLEWPEDEVARRALQAAFAKIDDKLLSRAAHIMYAHGHWASQPYDNVGGHWRFSRYASQVLAERLQLSDIASRYEFQVVDGLLRIHYDYSRGWWNVDVGLATAFNVKRAVDKMSECTDDRKAEATAEHIARMLWPKDDFEVFHNISETFVEEVWE